MTSRLGLTGSIGAGKSSVAELLRARGLTVLDADAVASEVSRLPEVLSEVRAQFGPDFVVAGGLNRPGLAELVFREPERRAALNAIIHPRVRARMAELEVAAQDQTWTVQDIPLLFEGGLEARMSATLLVDAPLELRVARVMARDGLSAEQVRARDAAQMPAREKRQRASVVIENDGDLAQLAERVDAALKVLGIGTTKINP